MLSTCQLVPDPVTVIAYCAVPLLVPLAVTRCWLLVTTKVRLEGPNERSELICAVPVETCFWSFLTLATPGEAYSAFKVVASCPVTRLPILPT